MKTIKNYLAKNKIEFMENKEKLYFSINDYDLVVYCNFRNEYEIIVTKGAMRICTHKVFTQAKVNEILKNLK